MKRYIQIPGIIIMVLALFIQGGTGAAAGRTGGQLSVGSGEFVMSEPTGIKDEPLKVFYYRSADWKPGQPVVVVCHGVQRNAGEYRDGWKKYADKYGMLIVCPEFSQKKYPGVRYYNLGNMADRDDESGKLQSRDNWIFPAVNNVIAEVKQRAGAQSNITVFGHSAGAQLVHRYIMFGGPTLADRIIAANAGWYTMMDTSVVFPYGIKNMPISNQELAAVFAKPVTVMLGEADTLRTKVLRKTELADEQGENRFERGQLFFDLAGAKANELNTPFNWQLVTVPGVGHDDTGMAGAAAALIAGQNR